MKERNTYKSESAFYEGWRVTLNPFNCGIFPLKLSQDTRLIILTECPKQILHRLPIAFAQAKAANTFENLLNKIRQITYSKCREKEITKKADNTVLNSIKLLSRTDFIFMNFGNSKTSDLLHDYYLIL